MFIACVKRVGACGETMWRLDAETREDAIVELRHEVIGSPPGHGEYGVDSLTDLSGIILFEVLSEEKMPLSTWYKYMKEAGERYEHEQAELRERREFERLRKKYDET